MTKSLAAPVWLRFIFTQLFLLTSTLSAHAASVTASTGTVKGHAPETKSVTISGTAQTGNTLHGTGDFFDDDGDTPYGSGMQWYSNGTAIPSANGADYIIPPSDAGKNIQFGYTPKTNPVITDPSAGFEVKSAPVVVISGTVVWTYISATNSVKTAGVPAGYSGSATCLTPGLREDNGKACPIHGSGVNVEGRSTLADAQDSSCSVWSFGAPTIPFAGGVTTCDGTGKSYSVTGAGTIVYDPVGTPATYNYLPTVWVCPSDISVNTSGTPGTMPAVCSNKSPAPQTLSNASNASPGWTHSP